MPRPAELLGGAPRTPAEPRVAVRRPGADAEVVVAWRRRSLSNAGAGLARGPTRTSPAPDPTTTSGLASAAAAALGVIIWPGVDPARAWWYPTGEILHSRAPKHGVQTTAATSGEPGP